MNACPVSPVCWASNVHTSACVKSPRRNDPARTLNALPPVIGAFSELAWMR